MTVFVLIVSAFLSAWAKGTALRAYCNWRETAANTIHYTFGAIAIGAGIQLLFRG